MNWFSKIHELAGQEYERYLPTAFDESLTLLEKVNKVIETLNQIVLGVNTVADYVDGHVNTQNEKIKQLRDDFEVLKEWLENEGLEERTKQVLNEWFDNGRLAEIINNEVFDMKADKATFEQFVLSITAQLQQTEQELSSQLAQKAKKHWVDVTDYGAKGDSVDDTQAILTALSNVVNGDTLYFPPSVGTYVMTQPLTVTKGITIKGSGQRTTILNFVGCDGVVFGAINNVIIEDIQLSCSSRYTITPNNFIAIKITGTNAKHAENMIFRDIHIDGFHTALKASYIWGSVFYNFSTVFCHIGMEISGLSVNNFVTSPSIVVDGSPGSRGIYFVGDVASEGWTIQGGLIYGGEVNIHGVAINHVRVKGVIIDFSLKNGILVEDNGSIYATNWDIEGCYIAMGGALGDAAIKFMNRSEVSNPQIRGALIRGNDCLVYENGSTCVHGIWLSGAGSSDARALIDGNKLRNFTIDDINTPSNANNTIVNNICLSSLPTSNIVGGDVVSNNQGKVYYQRATNFATIGKMKITYDQTPPETGVWNEGDICYSVMPVVTGFVGWVCTASGAPGTWKTFGAVST